jgi:hypothetical protein
MHDSGMFLVLKLLFYQVPATNPTTFVVIAVVLVMVAFLAAYLLLLRESFRGNGSRLFAPQSDHGLDPGGSPGGDQAGHQGGAQERCSHHRQCRQ